MWKKNFSHGVLVVATMAALFMFVGCEEKLPVEGIAAPSLTMSLPASLTNATPATTVYTSGRVSPINAATSTVDCNFGSETDPFGNGYNMTKFLVAISQGQSCFADFLIGIITTQGLPWVNAGIQATGSTTAGDVTQVNITQSTDLATYSVWLYFDGAGVSPGLYLTWTTATTGEVTGQMIWVLSANVASNTEPDAVRVDFSRAASSATNQIYIRFPASNPSIDGFRVDVTASGSGTSATYEAKGLVSFTEQWDASALPSTETFTPPTLAMVTVSDADGMGASIADFQNLAIHLENVDASVPRDPTKDFNLGSYQFTLTDKAYFTAMGAEEWKNKSVTAATYVNTSGGNIRSHGSGGALLAYFLGCLESAAGCGTAPNNIPGMDLNVEPEVTTSYFAEFCTDTDGAECKAFMQGVYELGFFGSTPNSTTVEPGDARQTDLGAATQLTALWPTGTSSTTAFAIP